jgi:arginase
LPPARIAISSISTRTSSTSPDAPLSEHPSRNTGLKLDSMLAALSVLASAPGLVAITLTEVNPHNAESDEGLLKRFVASFAEAVG